MLELVLQAEEVEMPKLGGALIPGDEKLFPESETGKTDHVGRTNPGPLAFPLPTAFSLFAGRYLLFRWGYNFLVGTWGWEGEGNDTCFLRRTFRRCADEKLGSKSQVLPETLEIEKQNHPCRYVRRSNLKPGTRGAAQQDCNPASFALERNTR